MTTRRLAAILAADVAGFSAMMERDEEGTAARIRALRADVIEPALTRHHGRLVKTTGDGLLAEFASPVEAVRSALAIQDQLAASKPEVNAVNLRIGINLGDIIIEDDGDVLGDGVNVAARLEQIAVPGGICISGKIHAEIEGKIDRSFEDQGEQQVKNIARAVRVYAFTAAVPGRSERKALSLPDKPSIAVLPFTNLSGDPEQEYFADGITDDLITYLSRVRWLFVIARSSSSVFKRRTVNAKEIARELGVRYLLEGSVQKAGGRIRITGQLVEAETGTHVWADRQEGNIEHIFELQDEMTTRVVSAIEPRIQSREIERLRTKGTERLGAYDHYLRALPEMHRYSEQGFRAAEQHLRAALNLDRGYSDAWAALTDCLGRLHIGGWVDDHRQSKTAIQDAAVRAMRHDPDSGIAFAISAWVHGLILGESKRSLEYAQGALRLHPNSAYVRSHCAWAFVVAGQTELGLEHFEIARRFNPLDPRGYTTETGIAACHFFAGRFDEATEWAMRARVNGPDFPVALRFLAASLGHQGRLEEARPVVADLLRIQPNSSIARARASSFGLPSMIEVFVEGLARAGLPNTS